MLREDQIQRYSRQILLRAVGGRGQEQLLSTAVAPVGEGPAFAVAAAYLAAGGTQVFWQGGKVHASEMGFFLSRADVGRPRDPSQLASLNEDASTDAVTGEGGALVLSSSAAGTICLCGDGHAARLIVRAEGGCAACAAPLATGEAVPPTVSCAAGAFAALVSQQLALGRFGSNLRAWRLEPSGALVELSVSRCERCASTR